MALVNVVNVTVLDNPTCFLNPFQFEITFECIQELDDDLEWKVLYVGSAHDSKYDQVLDEVLVGPVPVGLNKFVLQADPPDHKKLPPEDVLGVTVVLVACSYKDQEFVRIGYYVNNECIVDNGGTDDTNNTSRNQEKTDCVVGDPSSSLSVPPQEQAPIIVGPDFDMTTIQRQILADKPRLTKFPISWSSTLENTSEAAGGEEQTSMMMLMSHEDRLALEQEVHARGYDYDNNDNDNDDVIIDKDGNNNNINEYDGDHNVRVNASDNNDGVEDDDVKIQDDDDDEEEDEDCEDDDDDEGEIDLDDEEQEDNRMDHDDENNNENTTNQKYLFHPSSNKDGRFNTKQTKHVVQ